MMKKIASYSSYQILPLKCGFGIGYDIGREYWPIWVSVSVSELNQNDGFGRTLPTAKSSMKKASVKATYQKKFGFTMSNLSRIPSTKLTKTLKLVDFLRRKLLQSFQLKESYSKRRLDGNPLSCDCNLKWFIDFSHQVSSEKSVQLSAVCASPPSLADTPTESLWREHDMICGMYFKILQAVKSLTEYTRRAGEGKGKILQTCFPSNRGGTSHSGEFLAKS